MYGVVLWDLYRNVSRGYKRSETRFTGSVLKQNPNTPTVREREEGGGGEREMEKKNSNLKTLFYKNCSLGSVKNLSNS